MLKKDLTSHAVALKKKYGNRPLSLEETLALQKQMREVYSDLSDFGVVLTARQVDNLRQEVAV